MYKSIGDDRKIMYNTENKQQRGEEKRILISKKALELFKKDGYDQVTVDMIVKACKTSKGSFYHHFKSKADILNEQFVIADDYYEKVYQALPQELTAKERCKYFIDEMYIYLEKTFGREFLTIIYATSLRSEKHLYFRNLNRKLFLIYEQLLKELLALNDSNIDMLKQTLTQLTMGIIYFWCTQPEKESLQKSAEPAINHFLSVFD